MSSDAHTPTAAAAAAVRPRSNEPDRNVVPNMSNGYGARGCQDGEPAVSGKFGSDAGDESAATDTRQPITRCPV